MKCSWVKCSEVLQCSDVLLLFLFLVVVYMVVCFVYFCLILKLRILIVMYAMFCIFYFHRANWHYTATLTEVSPCFFLSCKANARVYLAKTGHGPHSS